LGKAELLLELPYMEHNIEQMPKANTHWAKAFEETRQSLPS